MAQSFTSLKNQSLQGNVSAEFEFSVYIMTETCFFNELSDCTLDVSKQWQ